MNNIHNITITPVLNGFICNVGCQTVVFESLDKMTSEISRYYKDPIKVEKEYRQQAVNKEKLIADIRPGMPVGENMAAAAETRAYMDRYPTPCNTTGDPVILNDAYTTTVAAGMGTYDQAMTEAHGPRASHNARENTEACVGI